MKKTAFGYICRILNCIPLNCALINCTIFITDYGLVFSPNKNQLLSIKGGLKPGYTVRFGTQPNAGRIESSATAKYLGVILDPGKATGAILSP